MSFKRFPWSIYQGNRIWNLIDMYAGACGFGATRLTNAIERLHEEFKRRIKTQTRAAPRGNRGHAVLGAAGLRADHHAQGRWLANAGPGTNRTAT